jgi:hypothetical protein
LMSPGFSDVHHFLEICGLSLGFIGILHWQIG